MRTPERDLPLIDYVSRPNTPVKVQSDRFCPSAGALINDTRLKKHDTNRTRSISVSVVINNGPQQFVCAHERTRARGVVSAPRVADGAPFCLDRDAAVSMMKRRRRRSSDPSSHHSTEPR